MAEIIPLANCDRSDRTADIVFVHGLNGNPRTTWSADTVLEDNFWPMWLSEDLPNAGIWSFGYEANASGWFGPTMPLSDRATNLLAYCQANGLGLRPLLFITHSMGGLLAKQALRHGHGFGNPNWRAIVEQTKGMVFLSTPHTGTSVMSWLDRLSTVLRLRVNAEEMRNHDRRLSELNTWYRAQVAGLGIETLVFCETQPWRGSIIVEEDNADPGIPGVVTIPVDANHSTICKPKSRKDLIYKLVVQFAHNSLQGNVVFTHGEIELYFRKVWPALRDWLSKHMEKVSEWLKAISTCETYQFHPRLRYDGPIVEIDSDARTYDPRFSKLLDDYISAVERLSYCIEEFNDLIYPITDSFYEFTEAKKLGLWEVTEEDELLREAVLRILNRYFSDLSGNTTGDLMKNEQYQQDIQSLELKVQTIASELRNAHAELSRFIRIYEASLR